jgi:malate synthase
VGVQSIEAWLRGRGAVPIYNLMEDAATAEISRAQIWQWLKFGAKLDTGAKVTQGFFTKCLAEELKRVKEEVGADGYSRGRFKEAAALFKAMSTSKKFEPFLTIPAYRKIL